MNQRVIGDLSRINAGRKLKEFAVADGEREFTWAELDERVDRASHALVDELGLRPGDCLAILSNNSIEYVELILAASRAQLMFTGLNTRQTVAEMEHQVRDSQSRVLIVGRGFKAVADELLAAVQVPRVDIASGPGLVYEALLARADATPVPSHGESEAPYSLTYTSGTTGAPRGALITSRCDFAMAEIIRSATEAQVDERFLLVLPLFHKGGQFSMLQAVTLGRPLHLLGAVDPALICSTIERERITTFLAVPTIMKMLVDHVVAHGDTHDLSTLRHVCYGSNPIAPETLAAFASAFRCSLSQIGGGTEGGPVFTLSRTDHELALANPAQQHLLKSCGRVAPGVELRIIGEDGRDVAEGEIGEFIYRGWCFISGYLNQPEATANLWRDGWLHSGDLGYRDAQGIVFYVDRLGGRVKSGGEMVIAREVEDVLSTHPGVQMVSIVGVPDVQWGEAVCAVVETVENSIDLDNVSRDAFADELRQLVRKHLAGYKVPRHILFVEQLPVTALGKVARGKVKEIAVAHASSLEVTA